MEDVQQNLIFVLSPPRAGSTLLQRMLGTHSEIYTHPEPHLMTPLAYLGYHGRVDAAPYDHINAAEAIRSFVDALPNGEADYLEALRAYAGTLYGKALQTTEKSRFLDKTPAYGLVAPFVAKVFPHAKFIVLTRHPIAVFSSYANSFYDGNWEEAYRFNPVVERYVTALGGFLRERAVPAVHVIYEDLVAHPEKELERIFAFCGLENQPDAANYGQSEMKKGMGDPIGVQQHSRPTTASRAKWAGELLADPKRRALAEKMIAKVSDEDLEAWGHPRAGIWDALSEASPKLPKRTLNQYTFQRSVMRALRKGVNATPQGQDAIRKLRYYCDVVLRDQLGSD